MTPILFSLFAVAAAPEVVLEKDIVYATVNGEKMMLDLARPKGPGPYPLLVGFHGGAWKFGSRKELSRPVSDFVGLDFQERRGLIEVLAEQGYAVASVSYRLAPKHKWPAQLVDARTAVRFLKEHAKKYDIDPERVGAFGFSAGGHLAALLGTVETEDESICGTLYPNHSGKVNCVVDYFGPTDMSLYAESEGLEKAFMVPLLGAKYVEKPEVYKQASPLHHVSAKSSPILVFHGTADFVVPIIHSERFVEKLEAAKVPAKLVSVSGKGHGWSGQTAIDCRDQTMKFFAEQLKKAKP